MAESETHRAMKAIVKRELEGERYAVVEEPPYPPSRISWTAYRPDLLGYRSEGGMEEVVLVECETRPSMRRLGAKNHASAWFQSHLSSQGSMRRILAVPQGKLGGVDMRARGGWEVWVIGPSSPLERFPATGGDCRPAALSGGDVSQNRKSKLVIYIGRATKMIARPARKRMDSRNGRGAGKALAPRTSPRAGWWRVEPGTPGLHEGHAEGEPGRRQ